MSGFFFKPAFLVVEAALFNGELSLWFLIITVLFNVYYFETGVLISMGATELFQLLSASCFRVYCLFGFNLASDFYFGIFISFTRGYSLLDSATRVLKLTSSL